MESNFMSTLNFAPFCLFSVIFVAGITVFHKTKLRWPVKVNCWFCNSYSYIWRNELNWWLCSICEQFNGFTKDGDYRYSIPEQSLTDKTKRYSSSNKTKLTDYPNGLCETCNDNEEYKLIELREFENSRKNYSDYELKKFQRECDERYPLCIDCTNIVKNSLYKQSLWLAEYRILFTRKSLQDVVNNKKSREIVYKIFLISVNIAISSGALLWLSLISGTIVQLSLCFISVTRRHFLSNVLLTLLWINVSALLLLPETNLMPINLQISSISLNRLTSYHLVTLFRAIIAFESLKTKLRLTGFKRDISFKKIDSKNNSFSNSQSKINTDLSINKNVSTSFEECSTSCSSTNMTDTFSSALPSEKQVPMKAIEYKKSYPAKPLSLPQIEDKSVANYDIIRQNTEHLNSLSLSEISESMSSQSSNVFSTKIYGTTSPELFQKRPSRKIILAPSKLRLSSQLSWPASNFWRDDLDMPSLSRSSSQSSGFGSNGGDPSRENSVFDADRCSVVSDTIVYCQPRRSLESLVSQQVKNQETRRESASQCNLYSSKCDLFPDSVTTSTFIMSPAWLAFLLCGSMIFNITVLCVVLLR